jgi:predicted nucleic-acid-binding protein
MIGLDTNVLVRYVAQDDPTQSAAATTIIEELDEQHTGFVSLVVMAELTWVLRRAYRADDSAIAGVVRALLDSIEIVVHETDAVRRALDRTSGGNDFTDALNAELGHRAGCAHTVTFDRVAARLPAMELISS